MTALQSILKEAKALKKAYPKRFAKWTDYVRQASAIYASKHKGKSPVGKKKVAKKKSAKKSVGKVDKKLKTTLRSKGLKMPHGYDVVKRKRKISGIKRKPSEKQVLKSITHAVKVQKSHMGNMGLISGMENKMLKDLYHTREKIANVKHAIIKLQEILKQPQNSLVKSQAKLKLKHYRSYLKELNTHYREQKKYI